MYTVSLNEAQRFDNSNLMAGASYILFPGTKYFPAVNMSAGLVWEFDNPFMDNSAPLDISLGLGFSKRWSERWYSYHWFNYTDFGQSQLEFFTLADDAVEMVNALVWEKSPTTTFILQCMYTEGLVENVRGLEKASHEAHIGIKWKMTERQVLDFILIENMIDTSNSPDFGLHLAYAVTF